MSSRPGMVAAQGSTLKLQEEARLLQVFAECHKNVTTDRTLVNSVSEKSGIALGDKGFKSRRR